MYYPPPQNKTPKKKELSPTRENFLLGLGFIFWGGGGGKEVCEYFGRLSGNHIICPVLYLVVLVLGEKRERTRI